MEYPLAEIFESLQGEGRNAGRPCVFVRFAVCNFACPWCDTDFSRRFTATEEEIVREAISFRPRSVILTGGEPTAVPGMEPLVSLFKEVGFWIAVETNGSAAPGWLDLVDYVACSPKAEYPDRIALDHADEVRVVASSPAAAGFCRKAKERISATDYYVSPCERDGKIDFATAKEVLSSLDGWSLSVQLHKILGFR